MDWNAIGTAIGGLVLGAGGVGLWWRKQAVAGAESGAHVAVVDLLRQEVERLSVRLAALEQREGRMVRHIYRLEGLMRAKGIEPPPFDLDSDTIKPGLTD
jgi:hypothetical protein